MKQKLSNIGMNSRLAHIVPILLRFNAVLFLVLLIVLTSGCIRGATSHSVGGAKGLLVSYMSRSTAHGMDSFEATTTVVAGDGTFTRVHETQDDTGQTDCGDLPPETRDGLEELVRRARSAGLDEHYRENGDGPQANYSRHREVRFQRQTISIEGGASVPEELAQLIDALEVLSCPARP